MSRKKLAQVMLSLLLLGGVTLGINVATGGKSDAYTDAISTRFPGDVRVDDLKLNGNDILDSAEVTRITVGATNAIVGNLTVTGTIVPTGIFSDTTFHQDFKATSATIKATTPTATGLEVWDTTLKMPVWSTGTATSRDWATAAGAEPSGY